MGFQKEREQKIKKKKKNVDLSEILHLSNSSPIIENMDLHKNVKEYRTVSLQRNLPYENGLKFSLI